MTPKGLRDIYVMVFLCLETRETIVTESTEHPNSAWVCERTEWFLDQTKDREEKPEIIIHDRDLQFTKQFTQTLAKRGVKTSTLPIASPNLNGRVERYVKCIKSECLSRFIIFGKRHLDHLISEFNACYNGHRAHSSCDHLPPSRAVPNEIDSLSPTDVVLRSHVGGLVRSFEGRAA